MESLISRLRSLGYTAFCQLREFTTDRSHHCWFVVVRLNAYQYWSASFRYKKQAAIFLRHVFEEVKLQEKNVHA